MKLFSAIHSALRTGLLALTLAASAAPCFAYVLTNTGTCHSVQKWDTSRPVKVRLLADSYFDYLKQRGGQSAFDLSGIDNDIKAVIALYNAIPGNALVLEQDSGITGDSNLDDPATDNFGTQTIVLGFTNNKTNDGSRPPAWTTGDPKDGCTRTRVHVQFRKKNYDWIFGPPDSFESAFDRSFYTISQPKSAGRQGTPITFLGVLTHEIGHAVGLQHPDDSYAVMAQDFRTWFRGKDALVTRLLPDDTAGVLALYGVAGARKPLDISVSNTWYKPASASFKSKCEKQLARVDAAAQAASQATGVEVDASFPADGIFKGEYADLFKELANAQESLKACEDAQNAMQVNNCTVSSRADDWVGQQSGAVYCGVNKGSTYAPVSDKVCPGKQVQLRYALNNHTTARDVLVKAEAWFTKDASLNALDGSALQSPDVREFTIKAASSANIGQVFQLPAEARAGDAFKVFVRAVPYDPVTGASLWNDDVDPWNNAVMVGGSITVAAGTCR
jgi:Matrixin